VENTFGPENFKVAIYLNNLADINRYIFEISSCIFDQLLLRKRKLDDYASAMELYERALQILEEVLGPNHTEVAGNSNSSKKKQAFIDNMGFIQEVLRNVALIHKKRNEYDRAEPLYQRYKLEFHISDSFVHNSALSIVEKAYGTEHPKIGMYLTDLADVYRQGTHPFYFSRSESEIKGNATIMTSHLNSIQGLILRSFFLLMTHGYIC
jgi:tetratricopeptide (TPR) repeat protein